MKFKLACLIALLLLPFVGIRAQNRTVIDKEAGSIFQTPDDFSYSEYGAFVGSAPTGSLDPSALVVVYGRFDKFAPSDTTMVRGFPYSALRTYESQQVAAGKPPIFVTATYEGKSRPVYFSWSLGLVNGVPTAPSSNWQYAVNVEDSRFVNFWINKYARPILLQPSYSTQHVWIELDECSFTYNLFGVLDDDNHFVAGVTWDSPFPQNASQYLSGVASFFNQVHAAGPDIDTMPNIGSMSDPTQFQTVFANIPGGLTENIYGWYPSPSAYSRNAWYQQNFTYFSWLGSQNKVAILRAALPSGDSNALLSSFVVYSLLKGPNFFFAPGGSTTSTNINPSEWTGMRAALGNPTSALTSVQLSSAGIGYRLYSRNYSNGTVYLNLSGTTQTIKLNTAYKHWSPTGAEITELVIPDATGSYVINEQKNLPAPSVGPRVSSAVTDPVMVTITSNTSGATIRYTLTGTPPGTTSAVYTGPFEISGNAVVSASEFMTGYNPSWPSNATFTVKPSLPTAQFSPSSATGPSGSYYPVISLSAVPAETVTVRYSVRAPTGATTTGSVTFLPNNTYRFFPITVSGASGTETIVTLTSAVGASIGATHTFTHTVQ
ncbi:MAG TPA: chitobiase/beta-hexosaminidase C-terminal domain-containing protein [Candidatus Acidoferrales bacterium]